MGLSIRRNPKRAHLLVSDVLGKHVPQNPMVIEFAGKVLGAMVGNVLNERPAGEMLKPCFKVLHDYLHNGDLHDIHNDWWNKNGAVSREVVPPYLEGWKKWDANNEHLLQRLPRNHQKVAVIGYAETATALGFLVAAQLNAWYVHSTRFYTEHDVAYGTFEESHSHATNHQLIPSDPALLNSPATVVLVDDEISTGNTAMNTIKELESVHHHSRYVIASLLDGRNDEHKQTMAKFAAEHGVTIDVVTLAAGTVRLPNDVLPRAQEIIENESTPAELNKNTPSRDVPLRLMNLKIKDSHLSRYGVQPAKYMKGLAESVAWQTLLRANPMDKTLVLGLEEFMYFPLMLAKEMRKQGAVVDFSSTTQSPVAVIDDPGYAIQNAVMFHTKDNAKRFAYNITEGYNQVVIVVEPGESVESLFNHGGLIHQIALYIDKIVVISFQKEELDV
ncbi:MAG: phosphoribosyltransferase family protein [Enterococcus sp.]|nr:phosphoribosyltransferase family protein [Enterococcus sp.]